MLVYSGKCSMFPLFCLELFAMIFICCFSLPWFTSSVICILPFLSPNLPCIHYSSTYLPKHFNHYIIFWSLSSLLVTPQRCYSWKHVEYYVAERKEHSSLCHLTAWMTWTPICAFTRKQNRTPHWLQLLHGCRVLQCSLITALINTQIFAYVPNKQN